MERAPAPADTDERALVPSPPAGALPTFAFLVHPLTPLHRSVIGARRMDPSMALGLRRERPPGRLCRMEMEGVARGEVIALSQLPSSLLEDQQAALEAMVAAVEVAGDADAIGLGSLLAVVAGRGEALAERVAAPITSGAAATAWAASENAAAALEATGEREVVVTGMKGAVGGAVVAELARRGFDVIAAGAGRALERRASRLGVRLMAPREAAGSARILVGASTTGGIIQPGWLREGAILLDVALPATLKRGRRPQGVQELAGEAVALPAGWRRGFWGWFYHALAGYGPSQVFACFIEPLVMAASRRRAPYALGRRVRAEDLAAFAADAQALGLRPRLARGWREVPAASLGGPALPGPTPGSP